MAAAAAGAAAGAAQQASHAVQAAASAAPGPFSLASWSADSPVVDAEPGLFGLLDHYGLPDELALQVAEALEGLESAQQQQQQQQHAERLARFAADYAQVRLWAGRGRAGQGRPSAGSCGQASQECAGLKLLLQ
ncbi:hypothetical protein OEZ86_006793 [Tetradesmus obliquus]|nr:hypothetical protein OEZ86_006793 [Tetradesmus obliquus]